MEELETQPQDAPEPEPEAEQEAPQTVSIEEWMASGEPGVEEAPKPTALEDVQLMAMLEACVYVAEEPLMPAQIAAALNQDPERIRALMQQLMAEFDRPEHGIGIREVAGGFKMATKPEHHEAVRNFVKSLKPPLKLSLPALETLAVVAYKQPVTAPEIMDIRGVQGTGVLKTLLERKLITEAGRKNVIGKPILFKTTKEFLIQFGLKDLSELPTLKEFEEIRRMALSDSETPAPAPESEAAAPIAETPAAEAETVQPETPEATAQAEVQAAEPSEPEPSALEAEAAPPVESEEQ
jgi:segregation and condensation protein B